MSVLTLPQPILRIILLLKIVAAVLAAWGVVGQTSFPFLVGLGIFAVILIARGLGMNVDDWKLSDRDSGSVLAAQSEPGHTGDTFVGVILLAIAIGGAFW